MTIRVLLVDDHTMLREALHRLVDSEPGMQVVGELSDGAGVQEAVNQLTPDVVVMDVSMPTVNGIAATRSLRSSHPGLKVVALSGFNYKQYVMEMLDAGATAYVVKSAAGDQLLHAIRSASAGETYLCPTSAAMLVEASRRGGSAENGGQQNKRLGRREIQVLRLLTQGKSSPQIGDELHIAPSTVDVHRRNIMNKLELRTVAELTRYAIRTGLVDM
jgi:two-component system NarL family response regulator